MMLHNLLHRVGLEVVAGSNVPGLVSMVRLLLTLICAEHVRQLRF